MIMSRDRAFNNVMISVQVQQQRQLKQQNQATLAALQQNAVHNQQQLADLQRNVTQLQVCPEIFKREYND